MRIEVRAKLILTIPNPKENSVGDIMFAAERSVNRKAACFLMPNMTRSKVGIRLHVEEAREMR